jgi:hypothetical protein
MPVSNTGEGYKWQTQATTMSGAAGVHDIDFVFKGDAPEGSLTSITGKLTGRTPRRRNHENQPAKSTFHHRGGARALIGP